MEKDEYKKLLEQAKKISITSVMDEQNMGYIDMRNFAQGIDHDSLMIDKRKNRYYWNSQVENGKVVSGDVVDFVTRFFDKSHMEALNYLTQETYEKGFIQEDKYKQAVFVWSDIGKAVGASVIGSEYNPEKYERGRFKGIAKNSESNFGFNLSIGTPSKLYVFESPIDLLSYWSLNPDLNNCMLAEMDGLKEESVFKFVNQMYLAKGALPTEGIYLGVDNDAPGHRFFDNMSKLSYVVNETKQEIRFESLIPHDLDIPRNNIAVYQEKATTLGIDWRAIAATHKALTNFDLKGKKAHSGTETPFFSGEDFDLETESEKVAQGLKAAEIRSGEYDFQQLFRVKENNDPIELHGLHEKVSTYYEDYRNLGYRPTDVLIKDWNDQLRYERLVQYEAKLLESVYRRNENEKMKLVKDEEKKKYVAVSLNDSFREPFFEADSPQEAAMLVKNYGFQAVDKEDRKKYQTEHTPEARKQTAWAMSR
ncbi:DUF3991 domain-containing protein (plasmid) [Enterococcus sp. 22-H-5-01]|uniref:DUF3991 domain-containing protein n=1 Tax=Enterococcus sp. 22-H-5-01 TaxID=3418555 RepID=UPI003D034186